MNTQISNNPNPKSISPVETLFTDKTGRMHLENLYQAVADFYREAEASTPIGHIQRLLLNWMESSDFEEVGQKYRNEEVFGVMQVIYHISKIGEQLAKCDHFETKIKTAKGV